MPNMDAGPGGYMGNDSGLNADMMQKMLRILREVGREPASPKESREIPSLRIRRRKNTEDLF
jgi:hypothetical protein